ncbi:MAG: hypothetical protein AVDCRST_MAG93-10062, partial [uncultured Chloroflexia bacterium]
EGTSGRIRSLRAQPRRDDDGRICPLDEHGGCASSRSTEREVPG